MNTKGIISIQDLVQREVIYCVSGLIGGITQDNQCLDEELITELWTGSISNDGYQREVLSHWIVSDWLCKKLKEHGQTVAEDVYNLSVWCRCDSGPISDDHVIQEIYNELVGEHFDDDDIEYSDSSDPNYKSLEDIQKEDPDNIVIFHSQEYLDKQSK